MGESSFNVYYILCDVHLYLAYLPVKSCITITIPASFLQFLTLLYALNRDLSGITRRSQSELPLSFSSALFLDF